jgi:hypothetical protein
VRGWVVVWGLEPHSMHAVHFHGPRSACEAKANPVAAHADLEADSNAGLERTAGERLRQSSLFATFSAATCEHIVCNLCASAETGCHLGGSAAASTPNLGGRMGDGSDSEALQQAEPLHAAGRTPTSLSDRLRKPAGGVEVVPSG